MAHNNDNDRRTPFFRRDESLESALADINSLISSIKPNLGEWETKRPMVLVMGCPRSGSTLLMQWFAKQGIFSYPSNLIARFYGNPYFGIRTQQVLFELDPINQIRLQIDQDDFSSELGKTIGALEPSEFWYFWRRYFQFPDNKTVLDESALKSSNLDLFVQELSLFEYLTSKPLILKGGLLNWHIPLLFRANPNFLFVNLKRDPFFNAQSLLQAREKFFGDRSQWYSFKPPEYPELAKLDPFSQVAAQVKFTTEAVKFGLNHIPEKNKLTIEYEAFCDAPEKVLHLVIDKLNDLGSDISLQAPTDEPASTFKASNVVRLEHNEALILSKNIQHWFNHGN